MFDRIIFCLAVAFTAINLGATLRLWAEMFRPYTLGEIQEHTINWTPVYCLALIVATSLLAPAAVNALPKKTAEAGRAINWVNAICIGTLLIGLAFLLPGK
ncbi:hypothetical protein SH668x_000322 [Planctomicrobium sp. SH668]|uniref:hypothetical protein n=1 Tax=Planctomicrobium sp. SH668 TaxID=3448126 RepID=UPI003F5B97DE